jgi:DNA-binding SARP family transcriptional activator
VNPPLLEIRLLGELEVARGGRALELPPSKRTRALLGYLAALAAAAVPGAAHSRTRLCELLWEGPADPRAALRWSLTKLRPLVDDDGGGGPRLCCDREHVRLLATVPGTEIDLAAVRALLAGGLAQAPVDDLGRAAARFRGDFLAGLELPDCYRFQEWLSAEREELRRLHTAILAALVERLAGTPVAALRHARAWVAVNPLDEAAQAAVVRLLGEMGLEHEAQAQYESCRRMLRQELAAVPSAALEEARRSLGRVPSRRRPEDDRQPDNPIAAHAAAGEPGRTRAQAAPAAAPAPAVEALSRRAPAMVGRSRELAELTGLLDVAAAGQSAGLALLLGEPGIGKSTLLGELSAAARARGGLVLDGRAFEAEAMRPYGVWIDALRGAPLATLGAPLRAGLAPLMFELGPTTPSAASDRGRLFDAVVALLRGLAPPSAGSPPVVVVVLDDLQWIDDASAALLHYVVRRQGGMRLFCVAAARAGELADCPAALRLVRALARERRLRRFELAALDPLETAELARSVAPRADGARVYDESRGNPLFALEVARALALGEDTVSGTLGGLISDRLSRLGRGARELLPWAAAFGRELAADGLAGVTGLVASDLVAGIAELERHGILRGAASGGQEGALDFVHDLIRKVAYEQISASRRRFIHLRIAQTLSARPDPDGGNAGEIARHAALGGDYELAARAAITAGERCLRLFAPVAASELAEAGLQHVRTLPEPTRLCLRMDLYKVFVHATLGRRRQGELERELVGLVEQAGGASLHPQVQIGLYLLSVLSEESGDGARAQAYALQASELSRAADPLTAVRALANTGRCLAQLERDPRRATSLLLEAQELATAIGAAVIDLPWGLGLTRLFAGEEEAAARYLEQALNMARQTQDHWAEYECMARLSMIDLEQGRPAPALRRAAELRAAAARLGEGSEAPMAETLEALARLELGEDAASGLLETAIERLRLIDTKGLLAYAQILAAEIDLAAGRLAAAERRAMEALGAARTVERRSQVVLARTILARIALREGDRDAAMDHLAVARGDACDPERVSARARRAVERLAAELAST